MERAQGKISRIIAIRLKPGEDVFKGIEDACVFYSINNGVILSAIGSLQRAVFANPVKILKEKCRYGYGKDTTMEGPIELVSATGMICHDEKGDILLHIHMAMSHKDGSAYGGHMREGTTVLLTTDVVIAEIEGINMGRRFDAELGVPLFAPIQI